MSRRHTPRRKAAKRFAAERRAEREAAQTMADIRRTARALPDLASGNLAARREAVAARYAGIRAANNPAPATFATAPIPTPKTIWEAAMGAGVPVPAPKAAEIAREYTPIKAADVPPDCRRVCKLHRDRGDLKAGDWFPIGVMPEGDDRDVYARLHGNSVRYAVAA